MFSADVLLFMFTVGCSVCYLINYFNNMSLESNLARCALTLLSILLFDVLIYLKNKSKHER